MFSLFIKQNLTFSSSEWRRLLARRLGRRISGCCLLPCAAFGEVTEGLWVYFGVSLTACMIGRAVMTQVMRHIIHIFISNVVNVGFGSACICRCLSTIWQRLSMSYWKSVASAVSGSLTCITTEEAVWIGGTTSQSWPGSIRCPRRGYSWCPSHRSQLHHRSLCSYTLCLWD